MPLLKYTLCFLTHQDSILMLKRNRPPNRGLWNGVGGHIEAGETPGQSILREVKEETGLEIPAARYAGILTWSGFEIEDGGLYIFTAQAPSFNIQQSEEGWLAWKPKDWVFSSPEVVSNIHIFGPEVFKNSHARQYHFIYDRGQIREYSFRELPEWAKTV
ncbi:MAG: 8-oxo-dGTP diphosphatase [Chloroflexi bacterium]|nr:8-oxo-dGTP diphosphatase [Chloroflexota bacterium]